MSTKSLKVKVLLFITVCLMSQVSTAVLPDSGSSCGHQNSIDVKGSGKVQVQPDIAYINLAVSSTAKTSQAAVQNVAQMISQVNDILAKNGIAKTDIKTQSISINPKYDYPDGKQELVGQSAQQSLTVTVRKIDPNGGNLGTIIDQVVAVNGIQFNNLVFDIENRSGAQKKARKAAFEDAKNKAGEFAELAGRTLGKAVHISDSSSSTPGLYLDVQPQAYKSAAIPTSVSVGLLDVTYQVQVSFALLY